MANIIGLIRGNQIQINISVTTWHFQWGRKPCFPMKGFGKKPLCSKLSPSAINPRFAVSRVMSILPWTDCWKPSEKACRCNNILYKMNAPYFHFLGWWRLKIGDSLGLKNSSRLCNAGIWSLRTELECLYPGYRWQPDPSAVTRYRILLPWKNFHWLLR